MSYQIIDWDKNFENSKSRQYDHCSFVCVPNKQHGVGLTKILDRKDGASVYGIWCLILGACSRQHRPRDGWLTVDGHPEGTGWVPEDLALVWRRKTREVQIALDVLSSPEIGWIKSPVECPSSTPEVPAQGPGGTTKRKEKKEQNERKEQKGTGSDGFEEWWISYPGTSADKGSKVRALKKWDALLKNGVTAEHLAKCKDNFAAYLLTETWRRPMNAAKFLGPDRHFEAYKEEVKPDERNATDRGYSSEDYERSAREQNERKDPAE